MKKTHWRLEPSIFNPRWYPLMLTTKNLKRLLSKYYHKDSPLKLVDFGCGDMPYKPLFKQFIREYIGLDIESNKLADININKEGSIPIENDSVDLVLSTQVLEHVENPSEYLSESFRILKNGGRMILSTHGYWIYHPTPNDYWRWTSSGLKKIIENSGFIIEK